MVAAVNHILIVTTDQHNSDESGEGTKIVGPGPNGIWSLGEDHYRWWTNAVANQTAAAVLATSVGADVLIDLGDIVDGVSTDDLTELQEILTERNAFTGNIINVRGNHEATIWLADYTDYYTEIDAGHVTRANICGGYIHNWTVDIDGVRYVIIGDNLTTVFAEDEKTWLSGTALATSLPVVVLSHKKMTADSWGYYSNVADIQDLFEESGVVQLVLTGHDHPASGGFQTINDILYCSLRGQVMGPANGDIPDGTYKTYYKIDAKFNAVQGDNQMRCNVEITAFGQGISRSLDKYGVFA